MFQTHRSLETTVVYSSRKSKSRSICASHRRGQCGKWTRPDHGLGASRHPKFVNESTGTADMLLLAHMCYRVRRGSIVQSVHCLRGHGLHAFSGSSCCTSLHTSSLQWTCWPAKCWGSAPQLTRSCKSCMQRRAPAVGTSSLSGMLTTGVHAGLMHVRQ